MMDKNWAKKEAVIAAKVNAEKMRKEDKSLTKAISYRLKPFKKRSQSK